MTMHNYFSQLLQRRHRGLIVLSGARSWATEFAQNFLLRSPATVCLWLTDQICEYDQVNQYHTRDTAQYLGVECQILVFDGYAGFSPNTFCAAVDTVIGGGIVFLIVPDLAVWSDTADVDFSRAYQIDQPPRRFIQRFVNFLNAAVVQQPDFIRVITPNLSLDTLSIISEAFPTQLSVSISDEQSQLITRIASSINGRAHRPLVITAARGRGKSTAIGMALADWLKSHNHGRVVLTGPSREAIATAFRWAESCVDSMIENDTLTVDDSTLVYSPVDVLLRDYSQAEAIADVVIVDEAAAIPLPILERLMKQYPRIVFVTTTVGYEGSGRGFALRFKRLLDNYSNQWRRASVSSPIRWAANDPMELWLREVFLLADTDSDVFSNFPAEKISNIESVAINDVTVRRLSRNELMLDERQLSVLFRLLVDAHYRTQPDDLRYLLDAPHVQIWASFCAGKILAAAVVVEEGALAAESIQRIKTDQHRPRGNLLSQTIALQMGVYEGLSLSAWRVVRIAVQPELQRKGLGQALLDEIAAQARIESIDFIGSSFAIDTEILSFWQTAHFSPLRMGTHRDHVTAAYAVIVVQPFSDAASSMIDVVKQRFAQQLTTFLPVYWRDVEPSILADLYLALPSFAAPSVIDIQQMNDYLRAAIAFDTAHMALINVLNMQMPIYLRNGGSLAVVDLPIRCILQRWSWSELAVAEQCSGKKALEIKLRENLRTILF
jgi:tRNA(Met) cytidine acetyltransferase